VTIKFPLISLLTFGKRFSVRVYHEQSVQSLTPEVNLPQRLVEIYRLSV